VINKFTRGLFVGRFQPLHKGHVEAIKTVLSSLEELIIIVGSSQLSHEFENPFTAGERVTMIKLAFEEEGLDQTKFFIIPVPDANTHAVWVNEVQALTPRFDIVYSNDPLTHRLFKEAQIKVKSVPFYQRDLYSSSEVRKRIMNDEDWQHLLPLSVADFIKIIDGVSRIKELALSDKV
jgi:nicotinamide-nucleotide adenylyltransferase